MAAGTCHDIADIPGNVGVPGDKRFGLVSRIRRACASIPTNLAEGPGRSTNNELARFIDIATGSASEVEYQLLLAKDLGYLPKDQHTDLSTEIIEIRRMLLAFKKTLRTSSKLTAQSQIGKKFPYKFLVSVAVVS